MKDADLLQRIKLVVNAESPNPSTFARKIQFNQSNLSKILRGERAVPQKLVDKILENTDINRDWLLMGKGAMYKGDEVYQVPIDTATQPYTETKNGVKYLEREDGKLLVEVPVVPYYALGSPEDEFSELIKSEEIETEKFEVDRVGHGRYYAFKVDGDSMDDDSKEGFSRGDIVLVRELDKDDWMPHLHINRWKYWVVCWGNNVRLKQIVSQENDTITLHSLNPSPEYCDFTLSLGNVSRLFNVIKHKHERSF